MMDFNGGTKKNIVLAGFMGVGKTTVGRLLASKLNRTFIDTDSMIEERMQMSIKEIFAQKGEEFFRNIESQIIAEVANQENIVIAIGGGAILKQININNLLKNGVILCLKASPKEILRRIGKGQDRPLLEKENKQEALQKIYAERKPLYDALPIQIETDGKSPEDIANEIIEIIMFSS